MYEDRFQPGGYEGTLGADLGVGDTVLDLGVDPGYGELNTTNCIPVIVGGANGIEVVHAIADLGDGTATIQRAREETAEVIHSTGDPWRIGPTLWDFWKNKQAWGGDLGYDQEFTRPGRPTTLPSGWSWVNQGTATFVERNATGALTTPVGGSGTNVRGIVRAIPSESAWTATFGLRLGIDTGNYSNGGIMLRDSAGGKIVSLQYTQAALVEYDIFASATSYTSTATNDGVRQPPRFMRVKKNSATSWDFGFSLDGITWRTIVSARNVATDLGAAPTHIGFFADGGAQWATVCCDFFRVRT